MKPIATDVYWIDTGMVNCYVARDGDELCLIDVGMPRATDQLFNAIAEIGYEPEAITRIILTYADIDHAGGLSACLGVSHTAEVFASDATAALVARGQSPHHLPALIQIIGDIFFRYPKVPAERITPIRDGDTLPVLGGLQAMATPGHTLDHLSYYSPSTGVLFAGDIINTRDGRLQLTPQRITADREAAVRSAQAIIDLSPDILACGHGAPLTEHTREDLNQLAQEIGRQTGG